MRIFKVFVFVFPFLDLHKDQEEMTKNTFFIIKNLPISPFGFTFQRNFYKKPWCKTTLRYVLLWSSLVVKCQITITRKQGCGGFSELFLRCFQVNTRFWNIWNTKKYLKTIFSFFSEKFMYLLNYKENELLWERVK